MENKEYDDFEPFCKWETSTSYDILKVYLQGNNYCIGYQFSSPMMEKGKNCGLLRLISCAFSFRSKKIFM